MQTHVNSSLFIRMVLKHIFLLEKIFKQKKNNHQYQAPSKMFSNQTCYDIFEPETGLSQVYS